MEELVKQVIGLSFSDFSTLVETFCRQHKVSFTEFCDLFALSVAQGYQQGAISWSEGDSTMNNLFALATNRENQSGLAKMAFSVFQAFDEGEYHPEKPQCSSDEVTKPLIDAILLKQKIK